MSAEICPIPKGSRIVNTSIQYYLIENCLVLDAKKQPRWAAFDVDLLMLMYTIIQIELPDPR